MNGLLTTAGVLCVLLAFGHATLGLVWVLPRMSEDAYGTTPFGGKAFSAATVHASWHIVTVFALASGVTLLLLASDTADPTTIVLRVFSAMWLAVATVAIWAGARRVSRARDLFRLPVPIFFVTVAVLCWIAST